MHAHVEIIFLCNKQVSISQCETGAGSELIDYTKSKYTNMIFDR
jgi:hypothetical protein